MFTYISDTTILNKIKNYEKVDFVMCDYPGCSEDGEETYFGLNLCNKHRELMQFVTDLFEKTSIGLEES